jgi:hypothetical protein
MKKTIKWRLAALPTPDELRNLVTDGIVSNDEAREILFSTETEDERDKASLEAEIKFLRKLVDKLSVNQTTTVIREVERLRPTYTPFTWFQPYMQVINTTQSLPTTTTYAANSFSLGSVSGSLGKSSGTIGFSSIK